MGYKLAFYSDQVIPENNKVDRRLQTLIGRPNPIIGYIPSSADPERVWFEQKRAYYAALGLQLDVYFEIDVDYRPETLPQLLACDAIHLSGGNTFHFLYWLQARQLLAPLRTYAAQGGVLIGTSAGAILLTPDINTALLCGDEPWPGESLSDRRALNLVDFAFVPHINDLADPTTPLQAYAQTHQRVTYGCADGDGIIVAGDRIELLGAIQKVEPTPR